VERLLVDGVMPPDGFKYTKGSPKQFTRKDQEKPVTREFCGECGASLSDTYRRLGVYLQLTADWRRTICS
jgi:hypothetical protein